MKVFIENISSVSPPYPEDQIEATFPFAIGGYRKAEEPVYTEYIAPTELRRMPRMMKMGIYSSSKCIGQIQVLEVDAITVGTGIGGFESFEKFETSLIQNQESQLSPTLFIQSLHNAVAGQIALNLKCSGYNMTYVHRGFSFETALLDAILLLNEHNQVHLVLVGGIDELTPSFVKLQQQDGDTGVPTPEVTVGEGSTFMLLSDQKSFHSKAVIGGVKMLFRPKAWTEIAQALTNWLQTEEKTLSAIDLVLLGKCGNTQLDAKLTSLEENTFQDIPRFYFKNLCGEYRTSSAFAVWLATDILQHPQSYRQIYGRKKPGNILIVNQYQDTHYSMIWVGRTDPVGSETKESITQQGQRLSDEVHVRKQDADP